MSDEQNLQEEQTVQFNVKGLMIIVTLLSIPCSFVPSLVYWLLQKNSLHEAYKTYLTNLLNFEITMFLVGVIFAIPLPIVTSIVGLLNLVLLIVAAIKLNKNEAFKFPLTIELLK